MANIAKRVVTQVPLKKYHLVVKSLPGDPASDAALQQLSDDQWVVWSDVPNSGGYYYFSKPPDAPLVRWLEMYRPLEFLTYPDKVPVADYIATELFKSTKQFLSLLNGPRAANDNVKKQEVVIATPIARPDFGDRDDVIRVPSKLDLDGKGKAPDTFRNALYTVHASGYNPAMNIMSRKIELRGVIEWGKKHGRTLDDDVARLVRWALIDRFAGFEYQPSKDNVFEAMVTLGLAASFNPVVDYLAGLKWDGEPRIKNLFGGYFNCGINPYTEGVSTAFMIGAVRRAKQPGCKFDTAPVLKGPQGLLKSTAVKVLAGVDFFSDADLADLGKDATMLLRGAWIHEIAEIERLSSKHDSARLKSFLSRQKDTQRDPYGRATVDFPRSTAFLGTTNKEGYLSDLTGARRIWPLEVAKAIDIDRLEKRRDQLWAEAADAESYGASLELPRKLWPVAGVHQEAQTAGDPWLDILRLHLADRPLHSEPGQERYAKDGVTDLDAKPYPAHKVHMRELLERLGITDDKASTLHTGRITALMGALGWQAKRSVKVFGKVTTGFETARKPIKDQR